MADFHYAPEVQYGYGSTYPSIVGFEKIDNCIKTAEKFFKSGKVWNSKNRRYVEAPDGRRETTLYKGIRDSQNPSKVHWTIIGSVVCLKNGDQITTSVWL